jgi:bile acid:Na+ symporter, BASS family
MDLKAAVITATTIVFVLSTMIGTGLGLRVLEIVTPLRSWRLIALAFVANFVAMPLVALGLARAIGLDEPLAIGLLIMAAAGGSPTLPKFVQIARANLALAVGLMVLLMVITVGYLPLVLPRLLPGVSVSPGQIAGSLVVTILLPLAAGLLVNERRPNVAAKVKPVLDKTSNLSLIVLVVLQTVLNARSVVAVFGTGGILAGVLFLAAAFAIGWALGGPTADTRVVLGIGTFQRNVAASLVVAGQSFDDPNVTVMIIVVTVVSMLILIPLTKALGRRAPAGPVKARA